MAKQRAVVVDEPVDGQAADTLRLADADVPALKAGEVLVKLVLRPVNPSDVASAKAAYPGFNRKKVYPAVPGTEGVGIVDKNGEGASKFKPGQRVVAAGWGTAEGNGTWQQYTAIPEYKLIPVPDSIPDETAAQFLVNPTTIVGFLEVLEIPEGKWLIQSAAGSELGRMMITLCKHRGIKTINIVRRADAKQELLDIGADVVISTSEHEDFLDLVKEATGGELAYGAIDPVAGAMTGKLAASVRSGGKVLLYGALGGLTADSIHIRDLLFRGVNVTGFWLSTYLQTKKPNEVGQVFAQVAELLAQKVIVPRAGKRFTLDQVNEAIAASLESGSKGKTFLEG